ncbi:purine permease 3-like [Tripterygium wilfordii]|uniref:purine permease 3-like n=1 Tax=Tripterygium wilfordii TaxID=458696 RepID=UPI0018F81A30|nr:purine permease 3-like [Tripterygium wilfordii]
MKNALLVLNCILLSIGNTAGPILIRLYFIHGGNRIWLPSFLQTAAFPLTLFPLIIVFFQRRKTRSSTGFFLIKPRLFICAAVIGLVMGFDNYLYSYGLAHLPVSTASLIVATQLVFTAGFAFLLVKQKFTAYSINGIVLLTVGAAVLALGASSDRPEGVSKREYMLGFVLTLLAAGLYGLLLPLIELSYKKSKQEINYTLALEFQMVMCLFATVLCTVGMLINNDFQVIPRESEEFDLGKAKYYVVLVAVAIILQLFFLGQIGVIFGASSLLSAIIIAVTLPVTEILAVIFFHEKFQAAKGVSLALSLWGFVSYFYGEIKQNQNKNHTDPQTELSLPAVNPPTPSAGNA